MNKDRRRNCIEVRKHRGFRNCRDDDMVLPIVMRMWRWRFRHLALPDLLWLTSAVSGSGADVSSSHHVSMCVRFYVKLPYDFTTEQHRSAFSIVLFPN